MISTSVRSPILSAVISCSAFAVILSSTNCFVVNVSAVSRSLVAFPYAFPSKNMSVVIAPKRNCSPGAARICTSVVPSPKSNLPPVATSIVKSPVIVSPAFNTLSLESAAAPGSNSPLVEFHIIACPSTIPAIPTSDNVPILVAVRFCSAVAAKSPSVPVA